MWRDLASILRRQHARFEEGIERADLPRRWERTIREVYPEALSATRVRSLRGSTLYVGVDDTMWISELEFHKALLKERMCQDSNLKVDTIVFTL